MGTCRINEQYILSHTKNTRDTLEARAKLKNTNRIPNMNHIRRTRTTLEENEPRASCAKSVINEAINIRLEKSLALTRLANARILLALAHVLLALARVSPLHSLAFPLALAILLTL